VAPEQPPQRSRRGPLLRSEHFTLALPRPSGTESPDTQGIELLMAIPKRQLKRAVDRNTVRRVAREAWRAATRRNAANEPAQPQPGQAAASPTALLRLVSRPQGFALLAQGARKRLWRTELDHLMAGAASRRAAP
jgi:hypothetical protein